MKIKTSELSGMPLNWAVAMCKGLKEEDFVETDNLYGPQWVGPEYRTDWAHGGPIIEREGIELVIDLQEGWEASISVDDDDSPFLFHLVKASGPTPLIAAMRCYVASKLGDEVEVPDELTNQESEAIK